MKELMQKTLTPPMVSLALHMAVILALFQFSKQTSTLLAPDLPTMKMAFSYAELVPSAPATPKPHATKPTPVVKKTESPVPMTRKTEAAVVNKTVTTQPSVTANTETASTHESTNATGATARSHTSNTQDNDHYKTTLLAWLERHKTYPKAAIRSGIEGEGIVQFRINRSGHLVEHTLIKSSGSDILDQAILKMLTRATPLPEAPSHYSEADLRFTVPVSFRLN